VHNEACLGQLLLQSLLFALQPGDPLGLRITPLAPPWGGQAANAPTSLALPHCTIWLECSPSRRMEE
jgi:hypothetical protein